jgi:hypothetical protein
MILLSLAPRPFHHLHSMSHAALACVCVCVCAAATIGPKQPRLWPRHIFDLKLISSQSAVPILCFISTWLIDLETSRSNCPVWLLHSRHLCSLLPSISASSHMNSSAASPSDSGSRKINIRLHSPRHSDGNAPHAPSLPPPALPPPPLSATRTRAPRLEDVALRQQNSPRFVTYCRNSPREAIHTPAFALAPWNYSEQNSPRFARNCRNSPREAIGTPHFALAPWDSSAPIFDAQVIPVNHPLSAAAVTLMSRPSAPAFTPHI